MTEAGKSEVYWRGRLEAMLDELEALREMSAASRNPVELDQQSVGRLSRMDAMQMQAAAKATEQRRIADAHRIRAALQRLEDGEFGDCLDCGEPIAPKRLELDPAASLCVSCAK